MNVLTVERCLLVNNPVVYIFLNKSLGMSVGKAAAQAVHAAMEVGRLCENFSGIWTNVAQRTVIVLEARDENHMKNIQDYLFDRGFDTHRIIDEGVNEIDPHVWTALATEVLEKDDEQVVNSFSTFNLYRDKVKLTIELEK